MVIFFLKYDIITVKRKEVPSGGKTKGGRDLLCSIKALWMSMGFTMNYMLNPYRVGTVDAGALHLTEKRQAGCFSERAVPTGSQ